MPNVGTPDPFRVTRHSGKSPVFFIGTRGVGLWHEAWHASSRIPIIERASSALDPFEDTGSLRGQGERPVAPVVLVKVFADGYDEFLCIVEDTAAQHTSESSSPL